MTTDILNKTAKFFNISVARMKSKSRDAIFCQARQFYVSLVFGKHTQQYIGDSINREHATIIHMNEQHKDMMLSKVYYDRYQQYLKFMGLDEPEQIINIEQELSKRDDLWREFLRGYYGKVLNDTLVEKFKKFVEC